jgi:Na+/H+-dicarboxylate symporter
MNANQSPQRGDGQSWTFGTTASLTALSLGLAVGILTHLTGDSNLLTLKSITEPVGYLWLNALQMTVLPLVVAHLIVAIVSTGSSKEVGWLGAASFGLFVVFLLSIGGLTALTVPSILAFFPPVDEASVSALSSLSERAEDVIAASDSKPSFALWLIGLIPTNPFAVLAEGALLPVLIFTILFGLALNQTNPDNRAVVLRFFQAVVEAMMVMVRWILYFTPIGIFALTLSLGSSLGSAAASVVIQYLFLICGVLVDALLLLYPVTAILSGMSIRRFAIGVLPAQVVALGTRSSLASLPALLEGAEQRLKLDPEVARLTLPLAVSTFKFNQPISAAIKLLLIAYLFGIELEPVQVLTFVITITIMSFSSLGIPLGGGGMRTLPAYLAAGVPIEALILFEAVEAIPDIFKTLLNVTGDMSVATIVNRLKLRLGRLGAVATSPPVK